MPIDGSTSVQRSVRLSGFAFVTHRYLIPSILGFSSTAPLWVSYHRYVNQLNREQRKSTMVGITYLVLNIFITFWKRDGLLNPAVDGPLEGSGSSFCPEGFIQGCSLRNCPWLEIGLPNSSSSMWKYLPRTRMVKLHQWFLWNVIGLDAPNVDKEYHNRN